MSSKLQQSTSTTFTWGETLLTSKELNIAKKEAFKELRSIQRYVKNGVAMHSKASANGKTADEELVRTALESIENMDLTQSNVAMLTEGQKLCKKSWGERIKCFSGNPPRQKIIRK